MHILDQVQVNLIYNTNRNLFLWIEIFISTTDLYNTTADRWSCHLLNRNKQYTCFKGTELSPANILIPLKRQLTSLQLWRWQFLYNETLQQTFRPLLSKLSVFDPHFEEVRGGIEPWLMARWKARVDLLTELLFLSLTVEALQGRTCQNSLLFGGGGSVWAKISGEGVIPCEYFLVSRKLDTFCYLTVQTAPWYVQSFWHKTGVWQTDGQKDGIAIASTALAMRALRHAVKMGFKVLDVLQILTKMQEVFFIGTPCTPIWSVGSAYFLHSRLKVLDEQFAQVVKGLQLTSDSIFKALEVLPSLFSSVKLGWQLHKPTRLLGFIVFQPLVVFHETIMSQLQLLTGTEQTHQQYSQTPQCARHGSLLFIN